MSMELTAQQKKICERIINVFESGSITGDYGSVVTYADGPHGMRQVTYGRSQTTEYGNLEELIQMYADATGLFSEQLRPFVTMIGVIPLADNKEFKQLLRDAGRKDPVMQQIQDQFFDKRYFQSAMGWADENGFTLALSGLVIYDSFIHSGSILSFLRKRFPEVPPGGGGNEKTWIKQYVDVRHKWLSTHPNKILQGTVYRTQCFKREITRDNWDLSRVPVNANGTKVFGQ